jgi:hypothetical protein
MRTTLTQPSGPSGKSPAGTNTQAPEKSIRSSTAAKPEVKVPVALSDLLDQNQVKGRGSEATNVILPSLHLETPNPLLELAEGEERLGGLASIFALGTADTRDKGKEPIPFVARGFYLGDLINESRESAHWFRAAGSDGAAAFAMADKQARRTFEEMSHHNDYHPREVPANPHRAEDDARVFDARAAYKKSHSDADLVAYVRAEIIRMDHDLLNVSAPAQP